MNVKDLDALYGFMTLKDLVKTGFQQDLARQLQQSMSTVQTQTQKGYMPVNVVLPTISKKEEQQAIAAQSEQSHSIYVSLNGDRKGPMTIENLKGLVIADLVNDDTLVWMAGLENWMKLGQLLSQI